VLVKYEVSARRPPFQVALGVGLSTERQSVGHWNAHCFVVASDVSEYLKWLSPTELLELIKFQLQYSETKTKE